MLKNFLIFHLIFISLNIISAEETKVVAEVEQNYVEVNTENLTNLKNILSKNGLQTNVLHDIVFDYLKAYKCRNLFHYKSLFPRIKCVLPGDRIIIDCVHEVKIIDINGNVIKTIADDLGKMHYCFCILENGYLVIGYVEPGILIQNSFIKIYDVNLNCVKILKVHPSTMLDLCALPNNNFAAAFKDGTIKIYNINLDKSKCIKTIKCPAVAQTLWFLKNNLLASFNQDATTQIWDITSGECLFTKKGKLLCVLPDNTLAFKDYEKIVIWDIDSRENTKILEGHSSYIISACLLSNKLLATSSRDGTVRIWDINTGKCLQVLNQSVVESLCSLSDGKFISTIEKGPSSSISAKIWIPTLDLLPNDAKKYLGIPINV